MNLPSWSVIMLVGGPHSLTTFLKNSWAINSTEHDFGVGMKVAYYENMSMITTMDSNFITLGRWVIKSREKLSHGLEGGLITVPTIL